MGENYDEVYRQSDIFGSEASPLLARFSAFVPGGGSVLDIGIGQGRNALPLARLGCQVTGIDPSEVAVRTVNRLATAQGLSLTANQRSFEDFNPEHLFDVVLCFGLLQIQDLTGARALIDRCGSWLKPGGTLFLTAWSTEDPSFRRIKGEWDEVGGHCFRSREATPRHRFFLSPGQILEFFPGWKIQHHQEDLGPWHHHGDGPRERHGDVDFVARSPEANP